MLYQHRAAWPCFWVEVGSWLVWCCPRRWQWRLQQQQCESGLLRSAPPQKHCGQFHKERKRLNKSMKFSEYFWAARLKWNVLIVVPGTPPPTPLPPGNTPSSALPADAPSHHHCIVPMVRTMHPRYRHAALFAVVWYEFSPCCCRQRRSRETWSSGWRSPDVVVRVQFTTIPRTGGKKTGRADVAGLYSCSKGGAHWIRKQTAGRWTQNHQRSTKLDGRCYHCVVLTQPATCHYSLSAFVFISHMTTPYFVNAISCRAAASE